MNKTELIAVVAERTGVTKVASGALVETILEVMVDTVAKGDSVALVGFGTFEPRTRAAKTGVNPSTGAALKIPATTVPAFKPGKTFKDRVAAKKGKK